VLKPSDSRLARVVSDGSTGPPLPFEEPGPSSRTLDKAPSSILRTWPGPFGAPSSVGGGGDAVHIPRRCLLPGWWQLRAVLGLHNRMNVTQLRADAAWAPPSSHAPPSPARKPGRGFSTARLATAHRGWRGDRRVRRVDVRERWPVDEGTHAPGLVHLDMAAPPKPPQTSLAIVGLAISAQSIPSAIGEYERQSPAGRLIWFSQGASQSFVSPARARIEAQCM
jgi:hypothetical protein